MGIEWQFTTVLLGFHLGSAPFKRCHKKLHIDLMLKVTLCTVILLLFAWATERQRTVLSIEV